MRLLVSCTPKLDCCTMSLHRHSPRNTPVPGVRVRSIHVRHKVFATSLFYRIRTRRAHFHRARG
jgi:hypothetical protein